MKRSILLASALACAAAAPAAAQGDAPVRPEQVVRVRAPAAGLRAPTIATVVDARADTLVIQTSRPDKIRGGTVLDQHHVAMRDVWALEVYDGRRSRGTGALLGAAIGTGVGLGAAALHMRFSIRRGERVPCDDAVQECPFPGEWRLAPYPRERFIGITLGGTVLGTAAGAVFSGRRWRHVLPVAPAVTPALGGVQLSGTLRF